MCPGCDLTRAPDYRLGYTMPGKMSGGWAEWKDSRTVRKMERKEELEVDREEEGY